MPLYEYYCKSCDGIFETIRPIREASSPAPCPVCAKKAQRVPPTSFAAFTMREGYPRAIPDRLRRLVPHTVPSGRPVLVFEFP